MFTCLFLASILGIILLGWVICFVFTRVVFIGKLQSKLPTSIANTEIQPTHLSSIHYSEIVYGPEKWSPKTGKCAPLSESPIYQNGFSREKLTSENIRLILEFVPDMCFGAGHFAPGRIQTQDVHSQAWLESGS